MTALKMFKSQERIDEVYTKIERIVRITIWYQSIAQFKRILKFLNEANRSE